MKTIIAFFAAVALTACAGTSDRPTGERSKPLRESSELSGSATQAPMVRRGNTMNDHDKLVEMCESMELRNCGDRAMQCHSAQDPASCLRENSNQ